jgi:acetyltransferase-like isoleucine patch superfamily enzyme
MAGTYLPAMIILFLNKFKTASKIMKTEKEKMLAGEPYDCGDTELINRWHKAKQLQKEYNDTPSDDIEKLSSLLDDLIGSRGENVWISAPFFVDYGENIHIGRNVEINMNCVFLDCNTITIGDYSGIGPVYISIQSSITPHLRNVWAKTAVFGNLSPNR